MQGGREGGISPSSPGRGGAGHPGGGGVEGPQAAETTAGFNVPEKNSSSLESICSPSSEIQSQFQGLLLGSRLKCGGTAEHRPALITPCGLEIDTENVARPDRGTDSYLWPWPQPLAVPEGAEAHTPPPRPTHPLECRDRGHRAPFSPLNFQDMHPSPQSL